MRKVLLEDCCEILDSMRVPITASDRKEGPYPYYGANGVQDYVADYIFDDELVLLAEDGGNFGSKTKPIAYRVSGKCWVNNHAHVIKPKAGLNVDFLCYSLMFYDTDGLVNGATRQKLTQAEMRKMQIPALPLDEQLSVVKKLNSVSAIKELYQRQLCSLDDLIKARFVEMFGTVDNNVFNYPVVRLGDYVKLQGGYAFKSADFTDKGIPLVQIGNVNKDFLDWEVVNTVPKEFLSQYDSFSLCAGDIVMAMTRPIIKSLNTVKIAKVAKADVPCLLNQRVGRFILSDRVTASFMEVLCKTEHFKDYVERMSGNSLQPNISSKQVEDYIVILPPVQLQNAFSCFVQQVDKSKFAVQKALEKAQLLFDSLMQQYFG